MLQDSFTPVVRFAVMSDVHIEDNYNPERERFATAWKVANNFAAESQTYNKLDAVFLVGDIATSGTLPQYYAIRDIIAANKLPETRLVYSLAGHEHREQIDVAEARLREIFGMEPDQHLVINGFHFIAMSTTKSATSKNTGYDEAKRTWYEEKIREAIADDPECPIFAFQHPHPANTCYGAIEWGTPDLLDIQRKYPQLITFSGHSHAPINDPRSIWQGDFTSLGTGSLAYFELDEFDKVYGTVPPDSQICAQFYIVEADAQKRVRVLAYDIITGRFFDQCWMIEKAWDKSTFTYTDDRPGSECAPYFAETDAISLDAVGENEVMLSFPQAEIDAFRVNAYYLTLTNESGAEVRTESVWSHYYLNDMPARMSWTLKDLQPGTTYTATVTATNFWAKRSENALTCTFTTK